MLKEYLDVDLLRGLQINHVKARLVVSRLRKGCRKKGSFFFCNLFVSHREKWWHRLPFVPNSTRSQYSQCWSSQHYAFLNFCNYLRWCIVHRFCNSSDLGGEHQGTNRRKSSFGSSRYYFWYYRRNVGAYLCITVCSTRFCLKGAVKAKAERMSERRRIREP